MRAKVNVASPSIPRDRVSVRIAVVEQHIRLENEHELEGVLRTFGDSAQYDDDPWKNTMKAGMESASFTSSS